MTISRLRKFIKVAAIAGAVLVLAAAAYGAWLVWLQPSKRVSPTCALKDANYCRFYNRLHDQKRYTLTIQEANQTTQVYEVHGDDVHATLAVGQSKLIDAYRVKGVTYSYDSRKKQWQRTTKPLIPTSIVGSLFGPQAGRGVTYLDDRPCGAGSQLSCHRYAVTTAATQNAPSSSLTVLIGGQDFDFKAAEGFLDNMSATVKLSKGPSSLKAPL